MTRSGSLATAAWDLVLAASCASCSRAAGGRGLCADCWARLTPQPGRVHPRHPPDGFPPTVAAMPYEGTVRRLILAHKEQARLGLSRPLGLLLAVAVVASLPDPVEPVLLVPVPSLRRSTRLRGHDPVLRMARHAAACLGAPADVAPVLRHRRRVRDQSGLSADGRRANLVDALEARTLPSADRVVVVVDDVCSSGATLAAAAAALRNRTDDGLDVHAAVVASPPLRRAPAGPRSP